MLFGAKHSYLLTVNAVSIESKKASVSSRETKAFSSGTDET